MSTPTHTPDPGGATPIPALHLAIRFALELAMLAGFAIWGWHAGSGGLTGMCLAAVFVVVPASIWATFGAVGDPSRGTAPVSVPGWLRLTLELAIFAASAYGIWISWSRAAAEIFLTALALHYAVTWERSRWLLRPSPRTPSPEE